MTGRRWHLIVRTWLGPLAALLVLASAAWLLAVHLYARRVEPVERALVDRLKQEGRTDRDVQKVLQPELDRQTRALVTRRTAYRWSSLVLLVSSSALVAWARWLRPARGLAIGAPSALARLVEREPDAPPRIPPSRFRPQPANGRSGPSLGSILQARARRSESFDVDLEAIDEIVEAEGRDPEAAIPILQAIQSRYRYLPDQALRRVCAQTRITPAQLAGVATFYEQFRHRPVGEHVVRVCEGTACHLAGSVDVADELRRCLGIANGEDTDPTGLFTVERVACVGSCSLAPVVTVDDRIWGHVAPLTAAHVLMDFLEHTRGTDANANGNGDGSGPTRAAGRAARTGTGTPGHPLEIRIGLGSCGIASGALRVRAAVEDAVLALGGGAMVKAVGCTGLCHHEPLIEVVRDGQRTFYGSVSPEDARAIVRQHVAPRGLRRRVRSGITAVWARLLDDHAWTPIACREVNAAPYLAKQVRVVLENCGQIDPCSLDEYLRRGGMRALELCVTAATPEQVIEDVRASGLRGRGGAGFPTATKWEIARRADSPVKFVICNGDEGDPGAFMDRAVLEADPFRVIEGLAIAAYSVGAAHGIVYVRREYPIAVRHVREAIRQAEARGFLGSRILGTDFSFTIQVREGAGAFVCGEETALIESLEGRRGMPRLRPPYPAHVGLHGRPTVINNVETLACLPWILREGADAFAAMGTQQSKGTKVFSLAGKVRRGGLIEVPMGITIREIVEEIGGGITNGRSLKAVLIGGPSGGCLPARLAETPIDYEQLASTGAIMGSGGLVVLDDRDCIVEVARYFLHFTESESCGKCTYCRIGTKRILEVLERICAGHGHAGDLAALEDLSVEVKRGSLCGLGQTAPNPVLTTLRYFREEYEAHVRERRCPAAQCKPLVHYEVLDSCTGCTLCAQACPVNAIEARPYERHVVIDDRCTRCGMCLAACPEDAIRVA